MYLRGMHTFIIIISLCIVLMIRQKQSVTIYHDVFFVDKSVFYGKTDLK